MPPRPGMEAAPPQEVEVGALREALSLNHRNPNIRMLPSRDKQGFHYIYKNSILFTL